MTNIQALESLTEYRNDNLFAKVLTDRGVTSSGTYSAENEQDIDMCFADVLLYLATHPNISEGSLSMQYTPGALMAQRKSLFAKWGLVPPETPKATAKNSLNRHFW